VTGRITQLDGGSHDLAVRLSVEASLHPLDLTTYEGFDFDFRGDLPPIRPYLWCQSNRRKVKRLYSLQGRLRLGSRTSVKLRGSMIVVWGEHMGLVEYVSTAARPQIRMARILLLILDWRGNQQKAGPLAPDPYPLSMAFRSAIVPAPAPGIPPLMRSPNSNAEQPLLMAGLAASQLVWPG